MKLSYTVIFLLIAGIGRFRARGVDPARVSPVIGQAKALNTPVPVDDCALDIAPSIRSEFRTAVKLFFPDRVCTAVDTGTGGR